MKLYEITYILDPKISSKEIDDKIKKVNKEIKEMGGELHQSHEPQKIKLGYPIDNKEEGSLVSLELDFDPHKISMLEEKLKENKNILRHMIVMKKEEKEEEDIDMLEPEKEEEEKEVKINS